MRVLVTGGSGFIGREASAQLVAAGAEVVSASRSPPEAPTGAAHEPVDLLTPGTAADLVARVRPTHLLHLAWNATPGRFWTAPDNLDWAAATLSLARAFAEVGGERAVCAGSCAEYAWDRPRLSERDEPAPATLYGRVKDATRRAVCAGGEALGVSTAWGRVFWLYGPGEARGRLISDVGASLARNERVETSEGRQARDFLHVADVAGAFIAALHADWRGPFNIGSGDATPVREVVGRLAEVMGRPDLVRFGARPTPPGEPPELAADISVLREEIGFRPRFSLQAGLEDSARWWGSQAV